MVAYLDLIYIYKHPVEFVIKVHMNKYPNDKETTVVAMDSVEVRSEPNGVTYHRRIATVVNILPRLLQKLLFLDMPYGYMEEECWQDWKQRRFWLKSRNLTFSDYASLSEFSTFESDPSNPQWTKFEQKSIIQVNGLGYAGYLLEVFLKKYSSRCVWKCVSVMEELLNEKYPDGLPKE